MSAIDNMADAAEAIQMAWTTCLAQVGDEAKFEIMAYVNTLVMTEKPYLWVTAEGIGQVIRQVFENEPIRDFTYMLQYHFMLRYGMDAAKFTELVDVLSWSASLLPVENKGNVAIPEALKDRLAERNDVKELLADNPWMVCLLVLRSYIAPIDPAKFRAIGALPQGALRSRTETTEVKETT